jgi:glycosyltransferase involved in cell wall biosynthesis
MRKGLIFSLSYYPHLVGGAEVALKEITDRIPSTDVEFDMITMYAGKTRFERIGNVNIYRVGPHIKMTGSKIPRISYFIKFQYVAFAFFKALLLQRKRHYDFTWSMMASFNSFSALFFKWIHPEIPFLLTLQEGDTPEHIKKATSIMYPLYVKIFEKANHIQAISNYLGEYGKKMGALCPIDIVPNGVNYNFFSQIPPQSQIKALHHELGIEPFDTVLITTSRLVQKNAVGDIIDSLAHLPPSVKLLILGTGHLEDMLKEKTALLKLENRVKFVGFVPHRELPLYLHASNIFVRPSLSEGQGVSFMEAMAAGLPVVATPVGGIPDFLFDKRTGLFCEVEKPESIAEKVDVLMKDKALRDSIVKNAQEMVKEKYDWNTVAESMMMVFNKVMLYNSPQVYGSHRN